MSNALKLGVNGAAGRMGQRVVALATQDKSLKVTAAYESAASPRLGQDAGELAGAAGLLLVGVGNRASRRRHYRFLDPGRGNAHPRFV